MHLKSRFCFAAILLFAACNENKADADWQMIPFVKVDSVNPVMIPDSTTVFYCPVRKDTVHWEQKDVFNPAAIVRNDTVFLLYRAEDNVGKYAGTSRIGIAYSTDGLHFTRHPVPVLYPAEDAQKKLEWEGGCEDPRLTQREDGTYIMTYTAYDGDKARLMVASSPDLYHWTKHGHAFANADSTWSKSGSIVSNYKDGKIVAAKINGKYWMYWGDTNIWIATSDDLVSWTPGQLVFGPRKKKFDNDLVEPGPAAMLTDKGILLIYNSRSTEQELPAGTYTAGQILMDKNDPTKVMGRSEEYFMKPDKDYETSGQVNNVCFLEGLVNYKGKWFLYYGTADSKIAVAVK